MPKPSVSPAALVRSPERVASPLMPLESRLAALRDFLSEIRPVPEEWLESAARGPKSDSNGLPCLPCTSYRELTGAWQKALRWTQGLDCALSAMLAASMSTCFVGEQLWLKIISPPSTGKTTLLEGLGVNRERVLSKDTVRGFYSGFRFDGEDKSLAAMVRNKTLATKDGDTLLKAPNLTQILSEARGLYDRSGRTLYRTGVDTDHEGHRMTWILCGTKALREIDDSELGSRFLDIVLMDDITEDFEIEVGLQAAAQEARNMLIQSNCKAESQYPPELAQAMSLTGGYLEHLCSNAKELYAAVYLPDSALRKINHLGRFTAFMRARPPKSKDNVETDREFSARLVKQLIRFAISTAAVLNRQEVDAAVMRRVKQVAMDTSRGATLKVVARLYDAEYGLESKSLAYTLTDTDEKARTFLRFLRKIGIVDLEEEPGPGRSATRKLFVLTPPIRRLYAEVMS